MNRDENANHCLRSTSDATVCRIELRGEFIGDALRCERIAAPCLDEQ
jgi:hypothetical protein